MINKHYELIMAFVEIGAFLIWVIFAHLFFLKIKRQQKPRFIIHVEGYNFRSMKVVWTNMSAEPVYVRNVFFTVERGDDRKFYNLGDLNEGELLKKESAGEDKWEYQGTLVTGSCVKLEVGHLFFPGLLKDDGEWGEGFISIEPADVVNIFVVFFHGSDKRLMGASRRFRFLRSSSVNFINPLSWNTTSWSTTYERKKLMKALKLERKDHPGFY